MFFPSKPLVIRSSGQRRRTPTEPTNGKGGKRASLYDVTKSRHPSARTCSLETKRTSNFYVTADNVPYSNRTLRMTQNHCKQGCSVLNQPTMERLKRPHVFPTRDLAPETHGFECFFCSAGESIRVRNEASFGIKSRGVSGIFIVRFYLGS
ncbi:hypothetical protein CDAR_6321 [Caerostris darwini]|uniref:Uncharacterized protein n=1 Tax=Caerostris darwini TaxID=1538125 RepID=A0AAV4S135_9ARAC|nr:hypothetical protein CDAR_6321 [Caerostris darwini]